MGSATKTATLTLPVGRKILATAVVAPTVAICRTAASITPTTTLLAVTPTTPTPTTAAPTTSTFTTATPIPTDDRLIPY